MGVGQARCHGPTRCGAAGVDDNAPPESSDVIVELSSSQRSVLSLCVDASLWAHGSEDDDVVSSGVLHHVPPPGGARELGLAFTSGKAMKRQ
ncbi:unnamed protein product [Arctogadus glacialis]